jgi:hypothetical protein
MKVTVRFEIRDCYENGIILTAFNGDVITIDRDNWTTVELSLPHNLAMAWALSNLDPKEEQTEEETTMKLLMFDTRDMSCGGLSGDNRLLNYAFGPNNQMFSTAFTFHRLEPVSASASLILVVDAVYVPRNVAVRPMKWINLLRNRIPMHMMKGFNCPPEAQSLLDATLSPPTFATDEEFIAWAGKDSVQTAELLEQLSTVETLPAQHKRPVFAHVEDGSPFDLVNWAFVHPTSAAILNDPERTRRVFVTTLSVEHKAKALVNRVAALPETCWPSVVLCAADQVGEWCAQLTSEVLQSAGDTDTPIAVKTLNNISFEGKGPRTIVVGSFAAQRRNCPLNMQASLQHPWQLAVFDNSNIVSSTPCAKGVQVLRHFNVMHTIAYCDVLEPRALFSAISCALSPMQCPDVRMFMRSMHKHPLLRYISVTVHASAIAPQSSPVPVQCQLTTVGDAAGAAGVKKRKWEQIANDALWKGSETLDSCKLVTFDVEQECPICFEPAASVVRSLSCGHHVCSECWKQDKKRKTCCLCRGKPAKGHVFEVAAGGVAADSVDAPDLFLPTSTKPSAVVALVKKHGSRVAVVGVPPAAKTRLRRLLRREKLPLNTLCTGPQLARALRIKAVDAVVFYDVKMPYYWQWVARSETSNVKTLLRLRVPAPAVT